MKEAGRRSSRQKGRERGPAAMQVETREKKG